MSEGGSVAEPEGKWSGGFRKERVLSLWVEVEKGFLVGFEAASRIFRSWGGERELGRERRSVEGRNVRDPNAQKRDFSIPSGFVTIWREKLGISGLREAGCRTISGHNFLVRLFFWFF